MDKDEVINILAKYSDKIKMYFDVNRVILYGSYAKGTYKKHSDIDVAVVVNKLNAPFLDSEYLLHKMVRDIDLRIEPVLFEEGDDPMGFLEEITKTGILVYPR